MYFFSVPSAAKSATTRQSLQRYRNQILRLRKQLQTKLGKTCCTPEQLCKNATQYFNPKLLSFFASQVKQGKRKANGRRYSREEQQFALATYYNSPRAYRFLTSIFTLPSVGTLHTWLRKIQMNAGWNSATLQLMSQKSSKMKVADTLCGIIFDAVHLQQHIAYNMATDTCEGTEDLGEFGRSNNAANYAIVFMVCGLQNKWKQLLGYFFYRGSIKTDTLKSMVVTAVQRVQETGFNVKFVTCDQDGVNRAVFKSLKMTTEEPFFCVNNIQVHWFYDAPHLLKSVRNNMRKYNLNVENAVVSWRYVKQFYEKDKEQDIRLAPKVGMQHIEKHGYSDMKVKLAAQVLSRTVAAGVFTHASLGLLPQEAVHTGNCIHKIDQLFDAFNSSSKYHYKEARRALSSDTCHTKFLSDMKKFLESWKFVTPPNVHIYCIKGWIININSLQNLWNDVQKYSVQYLMTRRLSQDPLEHLFGTLRSRFGNCEHPTPKQVTTALKTAVTNNMLQPPKSGNCEADMTPYLYLMSQEQTDSSNVPLHEENFVEDVCDNDIVFDAAEENAFTYVFGYACRRYLQRHNCQICRDILTEKNPEFDSPDKIFMDFKAENEGTQAFNGRLTVPTKSVRSCLKEVEVIFKRNIHKARERGRISHHIIRLLPSSAYISLCTPDQTFKFTETYVKMRVLFWIRFRNRDMYDERRKKTRKMTKVVY